MEFIFFYMQIPKSASFYRFTNLYFGRFSFLKLFVYFSYIFAVFVFLYTPQLYNQWYMEYKLFWLFWQFELHTVYIVHNWFPHLHHYLLVFVVIMTTNLLFFSPFHFWYRRTLSTYPDSKIRTRLKYSCHTMGV
jgi:hypothetical protein